VPPDAAALQPAVARAEQQYESVCPPQAVERSCAAQVPERLAQTAEARRLRLGPQRASAELAQPRASRQPEALQAAELAEGQLLPSSG